MSETLPTVTSEELNRLFDDVLHKVDGSGGGGSGGGLFGTVAPSGSVNVGGSWTNGGGSGPSGSATSQQQSYGINPGTGREYSQAAIDRYTAWNPASTADGVITPEEWAAYQLSFGANSDRWDSGWAADPNNYQTLKNALATGIQSLSGTTQQQVQAMYDQIYGAAPAEQPSYGYRPGDNKAFTQDNYTRISRDGGDANNDGSISADEWVTWMLNKGADAGYEQQWADKMAAAAGSGMLSSAVQQRVEQALNPATGGTGDGIMGTDYTQQDLLDSLQVLEDMGYGINMDLLDDNVNDVMAQITAFLSGDYVPKWISGGGNIFIDNKGTEGDPKVILGDDLAIDKRGDGSTPDYGFVLDAETIAQIIPGTIDVRTKLGDAINNGLIDSSTIPPEFLQQIQNQYPGDATIGDVLRDFGLLEDAPDGDLDGDGDLEDGGAFFDPPAPLSPTGEWQWNTETQDYDWVEGTQEVSILDEGSWTDDIRNAAGSITDKITDYILSQKPPSISSEDWMKAVLPNPSISVVQGGPDNTNIWIKLPGPLGDGLIDLEAIKNGEFTLDDAIKGKIDDAAEAIKGIPGAIKEKASTIFEEIKSAGKNIGDIFEQDGNIFAKILDASGEIIDTIEIGVGEIAGGWYTPSDAGWLLGDIIEILGEEFKYDGGGSSEEPVTDEPTGGDSSDGDSSTGGDTDNSGDGSTDTPDTSDGSSDGGSVPGGDETDTSDDDASEEPAGGDTGGSSGGTTDDSGEEEEPTGGSTGGSTGGVIDDSPDSDDDLTSGGGSDGGGGPVITPDDGSGGGSDDFVGGGGSDSGGGGGGGGGGNGRQGGMFSGGIGVDYSPLQSVIYKVGDPMVELERMISKSLFKDMI